MCLNIQTTFSRVILIYEFVPDTPRNDFDILPERTRCYIISAGWQRRGILTWDYANFPRTGNSHTLGFIAFSRIKLIM